MGERKLNLHAIEGTFTPRGYELMTRVGSTVRKKRRLIISTPTHPLLMCCNHVVSYVITESNPVLFISLGLKKKCKNIWYFLKACQSRDRQLIPCCSWILSYKIIFVTQGLKVRSQKRCCSGTNACTLIRNKRNLITVLMAPKKDS